MLWVKKARSGELLELALLLGLLRVDSNVDLGRFDVPLVRVGHRDSWDAPLRPLDHNYPSPKSVDSLLSRYDRSVLYDINLLGRYSDAITLNRDVTAYVGLAGGDFPSTSEFFDDFEDERFSFSELGSPGGWSSDGDAEAEKEEQPADERPGDELTPEDMELIEVLWKQDVDMGFSLAEFQETPTESATAPGGEPSEPPSTTTVPASPSKAPKSPPLLDSLRIKEEQTPESEDPWEGLSYTVDLETGEYILKEERGDTPLVPETAPSANLLVEDFSLEDALQLVGLNDDPFQVGEEGSEVVDPEEFDLLSEMLQVQVPAQPAQYHHSRQIQSGQQSSVGQPTSAPRWRGPVVEQRWQDLSQLLSLPPNHNVHPNSGALHEQVYHHAGFLSPSGSKIAIEHNFGPVNQRGGPVLGGGPMGGGMPTLTNSSEPMGGDHAATNFKVETPNDLLYYQNNGTDPNQDGFTSFLGEDDFLMDVAMGDGMYSMRMLETSGTNGAADSDSAVSSMGSERVPSLASDTSDWMETNSDSGHTPADHFMATPEMQSKFRWYDYSYCRQHSGDSATNSGGRLPPQKKYQLYGKRVFQEQTPSSSNNPSGGADAVAGPSGAAGGGAAGGATGGNPSISNTGGNALVTAGLPPALGMLKHEFPPLPASTYTPLDMATKHQPELKYSATLDFARHSLYGIRPTGADNVIHNHTYCIPPEHSGVLQRPLARDKKEYSSDGEDDDCAGGRDADGLQLTRDERRARALNIPIPVQDIINLPMDEFNERLSKHDLSEPQLSLIRDIRRRGKNKVAAQNCRKRKLDQILSLADEVKIVKEKKQKLMHERDLLLQERNRIKTKVSVLYRHIFQSLRDDDGNPLNIYDWTLQHTSDGNIVMLPRPDSNNTVPRHLDRDPTKP